jgi:putative membrane protein
MWGPMMGYGYAGGWMMALNGLVWLALLGLVAVIVWRLAERSGSGFTGRRLSGLDLLRERYARGEIQREEYLQKKQDLQDGTAT